MAGTDDGVSPFDQYVEPDALPVFVEDRDDWEVHIAPRFNHGRLRWAVRLKDGDRVLYEDVTGFDEEAAERFDIDREECERYNDLRQFVHRKFPDLPVKGNRRLVEYPLADVESVRDEWTG